MTAWRIAYALGLVVFVALPLALPFRAVFNSDTWTWTDDDASRLLHLAMNTLTLSAGTVALALPAGVLLAVLLFRTSFLGRRFFLMLLAILLFVPLPVIVSSWQAALGADGWLPLETWHSTADRPWATGMSAAIWVHALASVPWITFTVGLGLSWVEPGLEDEAAQSVGPLRVLALVTLPRARASVLAAALFVVLQTASEISVTDMMLVSTLAEEAYSQFAVDRMGLGRTLALSLPFLAATWGLVLWMVSRLEKTLPPLAPPTRALASLEVGPSVARFFVAIFLIALVLAPLGSLVWKLGLSGHPGRWSADTARHFLSAEWRLLNSSLLTSLGTALITGLCVALFAVAGCWLASEARWFRWLLFSVVIGAWVTPAPVVGIGLHEMILHIIHVEPTDEREPTGDRVDLQLRQALAKPLWHGPSPLPVIWVQAIRALPIAVIFLWPIVRMIPRELFEEARWSGAGVLGQWLGIVVPTTWRAGLAAALVSAALCLGEVAASTRVETPGWESFAKLIFERMHNGVDNNVSALCVLLLASVALLGMIAMGLVAVFRLRLRAAAAPRERHQE